MSETKENATSENEQPKEDKNIFTSIGEGIAAGIQASGEAIVEGSNAVVGAIADGGKMLVNGLTKTSDMVVDQVSGAVGTIRDGVYYIGDKAVEGTVVIKDGVVSVGENVIGSLINTGKFIGDSEYRETVGMPWLKGVIASNQKVIVYQMQENSRAMGILYRYSIGDTLSEEETEQATQQLTNMAKLVPALAIFLLPGGMVLLPMLAKVLPWDLVPDLKPPEDHQLPASGEPA